MLVFHSYLYCDTGEKWNYSDDMVDYKSFDSIIFISKPLLVYT